MIALSDVILAKMAEKFGIDKASLSFLGGGREDSDGILYSYPTDGSERVLKILAIPYAEKEQAVKKMDERLKFVHFLGENGVDIVYPIRNKNDNLLEFLEDDKHVYAGYVMKRINGAHPSMKDASPEFLESYGKTVGRLHRITKGYVKWRGRGIDGAGESLGWLEEWKGFYGWCKDEDVKKCWLSIKEELLQLPVTRDTYGFIHNDPHVQNIMTSGSKIILIDFDVASFHWFATDISIAAQSVLFSQSGGLERPVSDMEPLKLFFDSFMRGYETENHLDELFIKKMDLFINYRRILLFTVMQEWLEKKPEAKKLWKDLILESPSIMGLL